MAYTRKFVILKKELGNMGEKGLKGHGKLEVKGLRGTIAVNIENSEIQDFYNVDLITRNEFHNLGKIFIDGTGKGKEEYNFTQKEFRIEDIVGLLITRDEGIYLGGYINKDDGRIESYLRTIMPTVAMVEEIQPEIEVIEESLEVEEVPEEISAEEAFEEIFLEEQEEFIEELIPEVEPELNYEPALEEEFILEAPAEALDYEKAMEEMPIEAEYYEEPTIEETYEEEDMEPDYEVINHMKKVNQRDQTTNYILSILRFFPYIEPFKYELEGYNWWVVDLDEGNEYRSFLPYFSYLAGGNNKEVYDPEATTCNELMDKYQHYIFGLYNENEEVKYFVYGVPGSFTMEEHPNKGGSGFNTWYEGENIAGYWIIYIDPMTGKQVYPFNPMNPRE